VRIDNLREFFLYSAVGIVSLMPLLVLPATVGVLVDEIAMPESFAGWVASAGFIGAAVIALILAFRMHHIDLRRLAIAALAFAAVGDAVSAFAASETTLFLAIRFCTGLGTGAAYVAAVSAFARFDNCEQGYGVFITLQFIVSGLGLYLLPVFSASLGVTGMYLSFVGFDVLALLVARFLPGRAEVDATDADRPTELAVLFAAAAILAMLGFGLFEAGNTAQFTYIERTGVALDLSAQQVGIALLVASLIGIPGAFAIVLVGQRFGIIGPLAFGIGLAVLGLLILIGTETFGWYLGASCFVGFSWAFCLPYIQTLLAEIDPNGSAVAGGASTGAIGGALGPGLAALVVGGGDYDRVFLLSIGLLLIATAALVISGWKTREARAR
jgi:predicted MFS family arabinose efflux permease